MEPILTSLEKAIRLEQTPSGMVLCAKIRELKLEVARQIQLAQASFANIQWTITVPSHYQMQLTPEQERLCVEIGTLRYQLQRLSGTADFRAVKIVANELAIDIEGAKSEFVVCVLFRIPQWDGAILTPSEWEIWREAGKLDFPNLEVKSTQWSNGHLLIQKVLKNKKNPNAPHVLAIGTVNIVRLVGWCLGEEHKVDEFWDGSMDRACYKIPQRVLNSIASLFEARGVQPIRPVRVDNYDSYLEGF